MTVLLKHWVLPVQLVLFGLITTVVSQSSCQYDSCVVIQQCPKLHKLLITRDPTAFNLLTSRNCGYEGRYPKVCCTEEEMNYQEDNNNQKYNGNNGNNGNGNVQPPFNGSTESRNVNLGEAMKLLPTDCGQDLSNRIIGGTATALDEFPWMVLLEYRKPNGKTTACGGALISRRYVLTAAHCVSPGSLPPSWSLIGVRLGEYNTATNPDCIAEGESDMVCADEPITVGIEERIIHESYGPNSNNQHADIALIRLSQDVTFTDYIKPICLPSGPKVSKKLTVAGWGRTENRFESEVKLKVTLPPVDRNYCSQKYPREMVESQICAGGEKGKDSCRGDSGGPLMQLAKRPDDIFNRWESVGVVSYGPTPCGLEGWPGVYTNVYFYVPWILSKLRG
ncbi:melanization protease 1-like [Copidosoma floridanum]|uniref:melanization protease 1-like n=1 Tax=Copidosoma floridanum TaxID=29053 RepID=UPI0006C9A657|nr:melanization protease 1-like [Copidosoma floridanum]